MILNLHKNIYFNMRFDTSKAVGTSVYAVALSMGCV